MTRHVERLTIDTEGRDKGKVFLLTEMPADAGERWANRAALALTNTGAAIPEEALGAGWATLAAIGVQALGMLRHENVQPLLDELWPACVRWVPPTAGLPPQEIVRGQNSQIEEVATRYEIYFALWKLHTGFSMPGVSQTSGLQLSQDVDAVKPGWITSISHALLGLVRRFG